MDGVTEELRTSINNLRHRSTAAKWKPLDQWSHNDSSSSSRRLFITWSISWRGEAIITRTDDCAERKGYGRDAETLNMIRAVVWWETGLEWCLWLTPPSHLHSLSIHDLWPQGHQPALPLSHASPQGTDKEEGQRGRTGYWSDRLLSEPRLFIRLSASEPRESPVSNGAWH